MFSGIGQLLNTTPGAVGQAANGQVVVAVWEVTLASFGGLGLAATLMPKKRAVLGLGMELVARVALGIGAFTYAMAVGVVRGFSVAEFTVLTYVGISVLMVVGAGQIIRWLVLQRRAVDEVLAMTPPGGTS